MLKHYLLLLAFATTCAAPATAKENQRVESGNYAKWTAKAVQALAVRADANSLATAAALNVDGSALRADTAKSEQAALQLAARASELAPQRPDIGWLRLQLCTLSQSCDIRDIATVMRWVDPDNAAAWLPTLAAAQRDRDGVEVDRVLADMARVGRFDLYWNRIVAMMFDSLNAVRNRLPGNYAASDAERYRTVAGIAGAEVIPSFAPLVEACRESASLSERRELCLKLAKIMQRGDTIIVQNIGFGIERHFLQPDSKEARSIAERRHVLEWRQATAVKLDTPLLPWTKNARTRTRLMHMRSLAREEDVCIAILREHKAALDPPVARP